MKILLALLVGAVAIFTDKRRTPPPVRKRQPEYQPRFGDVDVREKPTRPEPVAEPAIRFDPIAELKLTLRTLPYGLFIEAATGMGFDPKTAWAWATDTAKVVPLPLRMAA